jgi:hypothetical protein
MDANRFTAMIRWLDGVQNRRNALGRSVTALIGASLGALAADAEAKKKRRKKRRKKNPAPPSCAELCGFACTRCFYRVDAPPLCGDSGADDCHPCRSDTDCIGTTRPYCLTHFEHRATGAVSTMCGPGGYCECEAGALGVCVSVTACG